MSYILTQGFRYLAVIVSLSFLTAAFLTETLNFKSIPSAMAETENDPDYVDPYPGCTNWQVKPNHWCGFAGDEARVWIRNCSAAEKKFQCGRQRLGKPYRNPCLSERVCHVVNPSEWESNFSAWTRDSRLSCAVAGRPALWRRASMWNGMPTTACTTEDQLYPMPGDEVR